MSDNIDKKAKVIKIKRNKDTIKSDKRSLIFKRKKFKDLFSDSSNKIKLVKINPLMQDYDFNDDSNKLKKEDGLGEVFKENSSFNDKLFNFIKSYFKRLRKLKEKTGIVKAPSDECDEIKDYSSNEDITSIKDSLNKDFRRIFVGAVITFFSGIISISLTITIRINPLIFETIGLDHMPYIFIMLNMFFLILAVCFSLPTIKNGYKGLFKLKCNSDTMVAVASAAASLQIIISLFNVGRFGPDKLDIFSSLAVISLFFNAAGKLQIVSKVRNNFKFLSSSSEKYEIKILSDSKLLSKLGFSDLYESPIVTYQKKINFLNDFLKLSYYNNKSDKVDEKINTLGVMCSAFVFISQLFITKDIFVSVTSLVVISCICIPAACVFGVSSQINSLCRKLLKNGAMLAGESSIEKFADVNAIVLNATQLYPRSFVVLKGIKTFQGQRIDEAILYASSIVCKVGGTLEGVFEQIIKGRRDILDNVEGINYINDKGIIGWVNGKRILIGNRELLKKYNIDPPSKAYEEKYRNDDTELTYLAAGGELVSMFLISYGTNKSMERELKKLENLGIKVLVQYSDPNITKEKICKNFGLHISSIDLTEDTDIIEDTRGLAGPKAYLATRGRATSFTSAIYACYVIKRNISLALSIQVLSVVLGVSLTGLIILSSGVEQLGALELIIYFIFWTLAVLIAPKFHKPI